MEIDFSYSIDKWLDLFRQFFAIISNFFAGLGIQLFSDGTEDEGAEDEAGE